MGTDELKAAVLREAAAEANALVEAATAKASQVVEDQKRHLEEQAGKRAAEHRAVRDRDIVNRTAALKIDLRNTLLKRKQELLGDLYHEIDQKVRCDEALYRSYLSHAVEQLGQSLPISVDCTARDESLIRELLNRRPELAGVRIDTTLPDSSAGLIAHFAEGDLDLTLSAAIEALRESTVVEAARMLFGDER